MSARVFNLQAKPHQANTLMRWMEGNTGAAQRAGLQPAVQAAGENAVTSNLTAEQLMQVLGAGWGSAAGAAVTPDTALRVATVYACVNLLSGAVASLPVAIFERQTGRNRAEVDHEYWWFLNEQANEDMNAFTAWQYLISSKLLYGDGIGELLRPSKSSSRVIGWKPIHPLRWQPFVSTESSSRGRLYHRITPALGDPYVLDPADVIHLPSLGFDGLTSPSPITYAAREVVGTALAAENYTAKFFSGGAAFDYALKTASKLDKAQLEALHASLMLRNNQPGGARSPLILSGGLEPAQLSVNAKDAEILGTRLFGVEEICRIFGVPPYLVQHQQKDASRGTGLEEMGSSFVRFALQQLLTPAAQELNRRLWPTRSRYFAEHVTAALERGNQKTRFESYRIALGRAGEEPFMSVDQIRRLENMAPDSTLTRNQGSAANEPPTDPTAQ